MRWRAATALGRIGKADERVIEMLVGLLSDGNSYVRENVVDALVSICNTDKCVIKKRLLSDESSSVDWSVAYTLVKIGILNKKVLNSLKRICENYKIYDDYVRGEDKEGPSIKIYDWAFQTLWQNPQAK